MRNLKNLAAVPSRLFLGAGISRAGDAEDIVGRWDHPLGGFAYYRFNPDGTFRRKTLLGAVDGKFTLLAGGVIELDTPGLLGGRNKRRFQYRINGDTLDLKMIWVWVGYIRAT